MRKRCLFLSLLSVFFLFASTHKTSADEISNILGCVKGGSRAKARRAEIIVRQNNGPKFDDSTAAEKSNWIDVTEQFRQAEEFEKATFGLSSNDLHPPNKALTMKQMFLRNITCPKCRLGSQAE